MVLYFRRTRRADGVPARIAQDILDAFFEDIDHSIRELGVGDAAVPKRMKKIGRMFYGRARSYEEALDAGDRAGLAAALARNIHPDAGEGGPDMTALAAYMIDSAAQLAAAGADEIARGAVVFPAPADPEVMP
jgi:cytochrome b pre-mRNA-processing protein 3